MLKIDFSSSWTTLWITKQITWFVCSVYVSTSHKNSTQIIPFLSVNEEYQYNLELQLPQYHLLQLVLKLPYHEMLECSKKYILKLKNNYRKKKFKEVCRRMTISTQDYVEFCIKAPTPLLENLIYMGLHSCITDSNQAWKYQTSIKIDM